MFKLGQFKRKNISALTLLVLGFFQYSNAQNFKNLDFEQKDIKSDTIMFWSLNQESTQAILDSGPDNMGLAIKLSNSQNWRKNFFQDSDININQLEKYQVTAKIKTDGVNGRNAQAYIWANLYSKDGLLINYTSNRNEKISGSSSWDEHIFEIFAPRNTKRIRIGGGLQGDGSAWFDDFTIKTVPFDTSNIVISEESDAYLNKVVSIMKSKALNRQKLNFEDIHQILRFYVDGAKTIEDTHSAINQYSRVLLSDGHSQLWPSAQVKEILGLDTLNIEKLKKDILQHIEQDKIDSLRRTIKYSQSELLDDKIGYISIPAFQGLYWEQIELFADSLQRIIKKLDNEANLTGWIIDLRENWGGINMAMVAGIGPLLDKNNAFYYVGADRKIFNESYYRNGTFYDIDEDSDTLTLRVKKDYKVRNKNLPIAILTNQVTASAGEVIFATFIGQPKVRSFGGQTNGAVTGNSAVFLDDGSLYHISTGYLADRSKKIYQQGIDPDVQVEDNKKMNDKIEDDNVIGKAKEWIYKQ